MNNALYASFLGMRARQRTLDAISDNIANASTSGFKSDHPYFRSVEGGDLPENARSGARDRRGLGVVTYGAVDFSAGAVRETGRALDVAIDGDAFLSVQTPRGERYTRNGNFTLDASGQLVTHSGDLVLGERGAITVPSGEVSIARDGTVSVDGRTIDKLKMVRFADPRAALVKEGGTLFNTTGAEQPTVAKSANVIQGALEGSNVNSVSEMVAMMQNGREFDSLQRAITVTMNDLGRKVSTEIGKI